MKPTVTIATIAYNEEANIALFVKSVLQQRTDNFKLAKFLIVSDGSTDKTVGIAKSFKSKKIQLIAHPKREGKSKRLNQIFRSLKSDYLVMFDADVILKNKDTIINLINAFKNDNKIGLVGGNPQPFPGRNLIERGVNCSFRVYDKLRVLGYWAYGCDGRILAMTKQFAKSITIPSDMIANDAYMYFAAKTKGFRFVHVRNAIVIYRSPSTIRDQIRQNTRFIAAHYRLEKIFGPIVQQEYKMPNGFYAKESFKEFTRHPLDAASLFLINIICRIKARITEQKLTAIWDIAKTTKQVKTKYQIIDIVYNSK